MKYVITQSENKMTRAGKPFIKASLTDESGETYENVSIWSNFPGFSEIQTGGELQGSIEINAQGYKNLKASQYGTVSRKEPQSSRQNLAPHRSDVRAVRSSEDYRAEIIRLAQDRKNESIAYFNATNAAISLVSSMPTKLMSSVNRSVLKQEIEYWRDWFLQEWKKHDGRMRYA